MEDDELRLRDRALDRYDSVVDWLEERTQGFDLSNLADWRNIWALLIGGLLGAFVPLYILERYAGLPESALNVLIWPCWVAWIVIGAVAIGTVGVPKCRGCGKRLKAGHYTCRRCGATSKPRGVR